MDDQEIRAEIERRRKRAIDLKLRQKLWSLYGANFKYIDKDLQKDPELIIQDIRETLVHSGGVYDFRFKGNDYSLQYREGKKEMERYGRDDSERTPITFALKINGELVFEFDMTSTVTYGPDMPYFSESFGHVSAFIEGPWVTDIEELEHLVKDHRAQIYKLRNAPKEAERLKRDMKRFGL